MNRTFDSFVDRAGRRWVNQSVVALMRERSRASETPQCTIRRLAREMIAEAKAEGWIGMPFDVELLAELQGIEVRGAENNIRAEARLMPLPNHRLLIEYAAEAPERRRRFSICHEIAHTFFPDCYTRAQHRRGNSNFDRVHAELEQLCHVGAGELLMPFEEFVANVRRRSPGLAMAAELGDLFNASQEAALRRVVDLSDELCCLVWLSERLKPSEKKKEGPELDLGLGLSGPKLKLRVDYSFPSPAWGIYIPRHKSIPDSSVAYDVLRGESCEMRSENWNALNLGSLRIEAVASMHTHPETNGIMALLLPD